MELTLSDEECLECHCGFTCGTPMAMQKHRARCNTRSLPASPSYEEEAILSRSLTDKEPKSSRRPELHHASSSLESYKTRIRRQGTDGTIHCPCGFTCGTPMAWERHVQRCDLLPNQPKPEAPPKAHDQAMGKKAMRLLLVRHGESANRIGGGAKCPDPALSEKGQRQADALAQRLSELVEDAAAGRVRILSSPMLRCLQTIQPALERLSLPQGSCICHGACYEHGCAGLSFKGTPSCDIVKRFPKFVARGFSREDAWDYGGANEKETSPECAARALRVLEMLRESMAELWRLHAAPILILVGHQTLGDLLLHLLLEGHSKDWQYGTPKYRLKNASISELEVLPTGQVSCVHLSSDYHVTGIR